MRKIALPLIALLLGTPAVAKDSANAPEITARLGKTRTQKPVPFPEIRDWKTLKMTLVRTACRGACPRYKVEIAGTGNVAYEGYSFVATTGRRQEKVPVQSVRDLYARFKRADFFRLFDEYAASITDAPNYLIAISFDGHSKQVTDYVGSSIGMPRSVGALENQIDTIANTKKWVRGGEDRPQKQR